MTMKKTLTLLLVLVMSIMCFTGCGDKSSSGDVVLKWYVPVEVPKDEAMIEARINELLEGKIDAKLDLMFIDPSAYKQKMGMIITASEVFDLCFTASWSLEYADTATKGGFLEISDLLDEYGSGIKELIPEGVWKTAEINGEKYAVPNYQSLVTQEAVCTYKELADKYGFDMSAVKTIEDVEPYFEIIKKNESAMIPFRLNYGMMPLTVKDYESIAAGWSINKWNDDFTLTNNEEVVTYASKLYIDWYDKGYIRADVNTTKDDSADAKNGRYGFWIIPDLKPGWEIDLRTSYGDKEFVAVPIHEPYVPYNASQSSMTAISATSKYPELAMQLLNIVNTDKEIYNTLCYGIEGTHYEKLDDGTIQYLDGSSGYKPGRDWVFGCQFNAHVLNGKPADVWDKMKKYNDSAKVSKLAGFYLDKSPILTEIANYGTVSKEYDSLFNGSADANEWDTKYRELNEKKKTAGADKIKTEIENQIKEWKNK